MVRVEFRVMSNRAATVLFLNTLGLYFRARSRFAVVTDRMSAQEAGSLVELARLDGLFAYVEEN